MGNERIIVGVDGSAGARSALQWAVDECRVRACALLLVHAPDAADAHILATGGGFALRALDDFADHLLTTHAYAASARQPGVVVSTLLSHGQPAEALLDLSLDAELLVVGTVGMNRIGGVLGSVSHFAAARAHCPVAVVPQQSSFAPARAAVVLVGVSAGAPGERALEFARREAAVRGLSLETMDLTQRSVDDLLSAAQQAELVVVGCPQDHDRWSRSLAPVAESLLHHSAVPVVVVGEMSPERTGQATGWGAIGRRS